jgi:prepilin-type processing-associated H-X9-DG protein/prepilin-type N-terminal cleavage/methylation domain-containing protein
MKRNSSTAFTLIELLVVIGVLGLLIAIIAPSLSRAKEASRSVVCKNLQKNYSLALYSYYLETNRLLPISVNDPVMRPWHTLDEFRSRIDLPPLSQEYKERQTGELQEYKPAYTKKFICPSARYALNHPQDGLYSMERSYGLNAHVYYFEGYIRRTLESQSSRIACASDALDWWFNYWQCDKSVEFGEDWRGYETYGTAAFRHMGKANISYWDGHVDRIASEELKTDLKKWLDRDSQQ